MSDQGCDFENGLPVPSIDFNYDAIDAYCFGADESGDGIGAVLSAFTSAFDVIANVPANDFKAMANRVDSVWEILSAAHTAMEWVKGDEPKVKSPAYYESLAIRVQAVRAILTGKDQVDMAREI